MPEFIDTRIEYLKGVGPQRGELLRKELGIHRYEDLVNFFPNRYIDRTCYYKINELQKNDSEVQIIGKIIHIKTVEFGKAKKRLVVEGTEVQGEVDAVSMNDKEHGKYSNSVQKLSRSTLSWDREKVLNSRYEVKRIQE